MFGTMEFTMMPAVAWLKPPPTPDTRAFAVRRAPRLSVLDQHAHKGGIAAAIRMRVENQPFPVGFRHFVSSITYNSGRCIS